MKKKIVSCFDIGEVPKSPGKWNWNWHYFLPFIFTFEQGVTVHKDNEEITLAKGQHIMIEWATKSPQIQSPRFLKSFQTLFT